MDSFLSYPGFRNWTCLIRAATDDRFEDGSVETEAVFLERIKELGVKRQNTLVR